MTDLLAYPHAEATYSLPEVPHVKNMKNRWIGERSEMVSQTSPNTAKELRLQMMRIGSAENVQNNLNRVILKVAGQISSGLRTHNSKLPANVSLSLSEGQTAVFNLLENRLGEEVAMSVMDVLTQYKEAFFLGSDITINSHTAMSTIVRHARRLDIQGKTDAALDVLYDAVDDMLLDENIADIDCFFANATVSDYSIDLLLGLLTVTLPARSKLMQRAAFFKSVKMELVERGEYEQGLLDGLE